MKKVNHRLLAKTLEIQKTSVENKNYLQILYRDTQSSQGETNVKYLTEIPCHSVTSNLQILHGEVCFLDYTYF